MYKRQAEESTVDFTHEEEIDFDTFCKVELRVAEVRACENLKESKKLLHLTAVSYTHLTAIPTWYHKSRNRLQLLFATGVLLVPMNSHTPSSLSLIHI